MKGRPLFGHPPDFGYFYYGSIWYRDELWSGGKVIDYNKDGKITELEILRWNDRHPFDPRRRRKEKGEHWITLDS